VGTHREFMPESPEHARGWTTRYRSEAIPTLMGLVKLVERLKLKKLTTPTFMAYSPNDKVVDVSRIEQRFAELGALLKVLVPYDEPGDPSYHVLAGRILSPRNTEALLADVTQFLRKLE
jgi:esterase/lipase